MRSLARGHIGEQRVESGRDETRVSSLSRWVVRWRQGCRVGIRDLGVMGFWLRAGAGPRVGAGRGAVGPSRGWGVLVLPRPSSGCSWVGRAMLEGPPVLRVSGLFPALWGPGGGGTGGRGECRRAVPGGARPGGDSGLVSLRAGGTLRLVCVCLCSQLFWPRALAGAPVEAVPAPGRTPRPSPTALLASPAPPLHPLHALPPPRELALSRTMEGNVANNGRECGGGQPQAPSWGLSCFLGPFCPAPQFPHVGAQLDWSS